jgi:hypothetical protein
MDLAMSRHCSEKLCMQAGLAWLAGIPKRTIAQREVVSFFGFFQTAQAGNWPEGAPAAANGAGGGREYPGWLDQTGGF